MRLWSSITDGAQQAWGWTVTPLTTLTTYAANTLVHSLNQGVALRNSIPALASPESKKILKAVAYITAYKILPLILLNSLNTAARTAVNEGREEENTAWYNAALLFIFNMIDWTVIGYTRRQELELFLETLTLDIQAPAAFIAFKAGLPKSLPSPCEEQNCNYKRRAKGSIREFFVLFANDLLTGAISYIPYIGKPTDLILAVYFSGDVIVRSALLNYCERHRSTDSELLLSLGLSYTVTIMLMDKILEATVGMPPFLVHRTMRHLMLLWHVNNAAHMDIKYVVPGKGTLAIDPIMAYERVSSFLTDGAFALSMDQLTKIVHPEPNAPPLFSLSNVLKKLTTALNSDLEKEHTPQPSFFKKVIKKALPPIFRSTQDAVHNPVIRIFWPNLQEFLLDILDIIEEAGMPVGKLTKTPVPGVAATVKKALPPILFKKYGISQNLTQFLIPLCKDEDFWSFVLALQQWLQRHNVNDKKALASISSDKLISLHEGGEQVTIAPPQEDESAPMPPPSQITSRAVRTLVDPKSVGKSKPATTYADIDPSFFARRKQILATTYVPTEAKINLG